MPGGFGFSSYSWPRGMWDMGNLPQGISASFRAGIGGAFHVTEDPIPAFSAMPRAD